MNETTNKILNLALLIFAKIGKPLSEELAFFCFAFTDGQKQECLAQADDLRNNLFGNGLIQKDAHKISLTSLGEQQLQKLSDECDEVRKGLEKEIVSALFEIAGNRQAYMFQNRFDSLLEKLSKVNQANELGVNGIALEKVLVFKMSELIKGEQEKRTRNVRDLLDMTYTKLAVLLNEYKYPNSPKKLDPERVIWNKVDKGIFHGYAQTMLRHGPISVNLLRINPKLRPIFAIDSSGLDDKERTLKALCKKHRAIAGTSGGFFLYSEPNIDPPSKRGDPVGLLVSDGIVINPPIFNRSSLIIDDQKHVYIKKMGMKGVVVEAGAAKFIAKKINVDINKGEVAIYTAYWGSTSPDKGQLHFSVIGRKVVAVSGKPLEIPVNGFVAVVDSGTGPIGRLSDLEPGDPVNYILPKAKGMGAIVSAMAGGPALLTRGRVDLDLFGEEFGPGLPPITFSEDSSIGQALLPRMAWGVTDNHELIACAVDGRNFERSIGMTLEGLAKFLRLLGCVDAINLDGGSSKRMVVQGISVDLSSTGIVVDNSERTPKRLLNSAILIK